jgi:hypothetical protein
MQHCDSFHNTLNHNKMVLIREPKNVDFTVQSKPWTDEELRDFRKLMTELKAKNAKQKMRGLTTRKKVIT